LVLASGVVLALLPAFAGTKSPTAEKPDRKSEPDLSLLLARGRAIAFSESLPGLRYGRLDWPEYGLKVHAWIFAQDKFTLRAAASTDSKGTTVERFALKAGDVFVINAGFFERDKKGVLEASGLLIIDGRETTPENERAGSGIAYSGRAGVAIGYRKELADRSGMTSAVQVGPVLVDAGGRVGVLNSRHDREERSAICTRENEFATFVVEGGLSLYQLAELLARPAAEGGFGCDVALNLDGGPSTQALFRTANQRLFVPGGWPVQNALVVSSRPQP
jgi:hypothetical protein